MAYVRTVRTSSGAVAVQVVWKSRHGSRDIEHLGSAHTDAEVEVLKAVAAQRIADDVKVARLEPVSAPHVAQQVRRDAAVRSRAARAVGPLEPVACEGVERVVQRLDLQLEAVHLGGEVVRGHVVARRPPCWAVRFRG